MADEATWQYHVDSPARRSFSETVNERRYGPSLDRQEERAYLEDGNDPDESGEDDDTDWLDSFDSRHRPN